MGGQAKAATQRTSVAKCMVIALRFSNATFVARWRRTGVEETPTSATDAITKRIRCSTILALELHCAPFRSLTHASCLRKAKALFGHLCLVARLVTALLRWTRRWWPWAFQ